jgi:ATP-dependent Clp protease ATP-binding subunit ClpA
VFDRFTDRARKVVGWSRQEAQRFQHDYIGTEHILLGLIREGGGVAADVLRNLSVDPLRVREEVEKRMKAGTASVTMGQLPFTPRAKRVLELSLEEARDLGHNYIGTEHLFLGLIREEEGIAAQALRALHVRTEDARGHVRKLLGEESAKAPEGPPDPRNLLVARALDRASDHARRLRHAHIGTEHILLGLLDAGGGALWNLLTGRIREEIEKLVTPGAEPVASPSLGPPAQAALDRALEAARGLGHAKVGSGHLLLGLIDEKDGIPARALAAAGITPDRVRAEIRRP